MREIIARRVQSQDKALTIISGDFNTSSELEGRWSKKAGGWAGDRDKAEEEHWRSLMETGKGFYELEQPHNTFENKQCSSRIDRVYVNQHRSGQFGAQIGCVALSWAKHLSDHRPLAFFRRLNSKESRTERNPGQGWYKSGSWPKRTAATFLAKVTAEKSLAGEISKSLELRLLKEAMKEAARSLEAEGVKKAERREDEEEDNMAFLTAFARAIERGEGARALRIAEACPYIYTLVKVEDPLLRNNGGLRRIKDEIVALYKQQTLSELQELHLASEADGEEGITARRGGIARRIRKLKPGASSGLLAIKTSDGRISTDPQEIATELERYWRKVFRREPINVHKLARWLEEEGSQEGSMRRLVQAVDSAEWDIGAQHVRKALDCSKDTMPGPDGIPYVAWRRLGVLSQSVLLGTIKELSQEDGLVKLRQAFGSDGEEAHLFNEAIMAFIPKKPCCAQDGLEVYEAGGVRPLSIVNTDNRLMANAVRWMMEPILNRIISSEQKGFLRGRSLLANVVEIEDSLMKLSLRDESAAGIFFDFQAAFPSLSHGYIHMVLRDIGVPLEVRRLVTAFYDQHFGTIRLANGAHGRITIEAGIRQGCPLSPLLFALVCDIFLRRLKRKFGDSSFSAYADDIAMACPRFLDKLEDIDDEFDAFGDVSGLRLHYGKIQVIPLWMEDFEAVKVRMGKIHYRWRTVKVDHKAEYLGFQVGPGRDTHSWDKPRRKLLRKAAEWGKIGLGLTEALCVYNSYLLPTLLFVAQLESVPPRYQDWERGAFKALSKGPKEWANPIVFKSLRSNLHFPVEAKDLATIARVAKARVAMRENRAYGGLHIHSRHEALKAHLSDSEAGCCGAFHAKVWQSWYSSSHSATLLRSLEELKKGGVNVPCIVQEMTSSKGTGGAGKIKHLQATLLKAWGSPRFEIRGIVLKWMKRWCTGQWDSNKVERALRVMARLEKLTPPKVRAAILRTWSNCWCTARRFQGEACCIFGCPWRKTDSIEHYSVCPRLCEWSRRSLGINLTGSMQDKRRRFLLLESEHESDHSLALLALSLAAIYSAHNKCRHGARTIPQERINMLSQSLLDMAEGCRFSMRCVCNLRPGFLGQYSYYPPAPSP